MLTEASFVTTGRSFAFELPDELDPQPDLHGIITYNRIGRFITYRPTAREESPNGHPLRVHRFDMSRNGSTASVYQTMDQPSTWIAYWQVATGYVQTFMDSRGQCEADPAAALRRVIAGITIRTSNAGLPTVEADGDVGLGSPNQPGLRERMIFFPRAQRTRWWPTVMIWNEPPWVPQGTRRWKEEGAAAVAETNELNMTVEVRGPGERAEELSRHAARISSSAVPLN